MDDDRKKEYLDSADSFLATLDPAGGGWAREE
jgi:hypothetical protein